MGKFHGKAYRIMPVLLTVSLSLTCCALPEADTANPNGYISETMNDTNNAIETESGILSQSQTPDFEAQNAQETINGQEEEAAAQAAAQATATQAAEEEARRQAEAEAAATQAAAQAAAEEEARRQAEAEAAAQAAAAQAAAEEEARRQAEAEAAAQAAAAQAAAVEEARRQAEAEAAAQAAAAQAAAEEEARRQAEAEAAAQADAGDVLSQVVALCNVQRANEGLGALTMTAELNAVAATRAQETTTYFSHSRPDGSTCFDLMDAYGVSYHAAGENIAAGQDGADEVVSSWMNSPGHRANILHGGFNHAGVGCAYANDEYGIY